MNLKSSFRKIILGAIVSVASVGSALLRRIRRSPAIA